MADLICLEGEVIDESKPLTIFDEHDIWKKKTITNYYVKDLLTPIFKDGKQIYELPSLEDVRKNCQNELNSLWDEVRRLRNPHAYYVDLSEKLYNLKYGMIKELTNHC